MRYRVAYVVWALVGFLVSGVALGQSSSSQVYGSGGQSSGTGSSGQPGTGSVAPGGAAMADFTTLINLIEQTIDPDGWLNAGGTSTTIPYPSGVYVDPKGHVRQIREDANLSPDLLKRSQSRDLPPWQSESKLRTVSLRSLEESLAKAALAGKIPPAELLRLAGLSRIEYVRVDAANEDVLLAGPAGEPGFGFHLQDLAVVAALIKSKTVPLGCSIEPSDAGIVAAQSLLGRPGMMQRLSRRPKQVVQQMQDAIGAHRVHVFGMNPATGTALALLDADEHMKKVGFGTVRTSPRVESYFDHLDKQRTVAAQSLIRWWFAYSGDKIKVSPTRDMFQLPEQCVRVLSEQQWVSRTGRAPTGQNDPSADAFASGFSSQIPQLRVSNPSYARLCAVFESALALQLALDSTGQHSLQAWFPNLCSLGMVQANDAVVPKTVEGLTTSHKLRNGTIVAVVSGGVKVDTASSAAKDKWQTSQFLAVSMVPQPPAQASAIHGNWWWD